MAGRKASPETLTIRAIVEKIPKAKLKDTKATDLEPALKKVKLDFETFKATVNTELTKKKKAEGLTRPRKPKAPKSLQAPKKTVAPSFDLAASIKLIKAVEGFTADFESVDDAKTTIKQVEKLVEQVGSYKEVLAVIDYIGEE